MPLLPTVPSLFVTSASSIRLKWTGWIAQRNIGILYTPVGYVVERNQREAPDDWTQGADVVPQSAGFVENGILVFYHHVTSLDQFTWYRFRVTIQYRDGTLVKRSDDGDPTTFIMTGTSVMTTRMSEFVDAGGDVIPMGMSLRARTENSISISWTPRDVGRPEHLDATNSYQVWHSIIVYNFNW